jgi:DNA mismatch repair ATPase MutS
MLLKILFRKLYIYLNSRVAFTKLKFSKEIDIINKFKHETHFCAFDELYSGTNPDEASISAIAFMEYIISNKNVNTILTTHFMKVCKNLQKNKQIINYCMSTIKKDNKLQFLYKPISI